MTRYSASGTHVSALDGRAVKAQLAASSTRASRARLSRAFDTARCQPGRPPGAGRVVRGAGLVPLHLPPAVSPRLALRSLLSAGRGRRVHSVGVCAVRGQCLPMKSSRRHAEVALQIPAPSLPYSVGVGRGGG